jgi:hypothetical protein
MAETGETMEVGSKMNGDKHGVSGSRSHEDDEERRIKKLLELNDDLLNLGHLSEKLLCCVRETDSASRLLVGRLFSLAMKHLEAIQLLAQRGYGESAAVIARSLVEAAVSAQYVLKGGDESDARARRFVDYAPVILEKRLGDYGCDIPDTPPFNDPQKVSQIRAQASQFRSRYGSKTTTWSGLTMSEMAKAASPSSTTFYTGVYRPLSSAVHGTIWALPHLVEEGGAVRFHHGPSGAWVPNALAASFAGFAWCLDAVLTAYGYGESAVLKDIFDRLAERYNEAAV